ncbi:Mnn10p [Sugiyamaella lignohabitans]|uniref:Mnn10p n=1 Tax=Sugiyamaella lignohabitans TaxID=796027 RepID=A0A161HUI0_9ASCO|nr:Mnn10p [Sugiyamaella lignohabitans]ANB10933.1 Mnn10p [Sugiyamaella lignohabitans]
MRLPQAAFLACASFAILATIWYMATFSTVDATKWKLPSSVGNSKPNKVKIQKTATAPVDPILLPPKTKTLAKVPIPTTTTEVLTDTEMQIERLQEALRSKDKKIADSVQQLKDKDRLYNEEQEKKDKEVAAKLDALKKAQASLNDQKEKVQKEKEEERKKKEEEERKKKELEEEKKKKEEEEKKKEEEDRKSLTDAYYIIRDRMLLEEHKLLEPIEIPDEERHNHYDKDNKLMPNGKKILLLSAFDGAGSTDNDLTDLFMSNREEYANYHGYTHLFVNTTKYKKNDKLKRPAVWFKLPAIKEAFEKFPEVEWIWWVDTDIIIMNEEIDLAAHVLNPYVLSNRLTYERPVNDLGDHFSGSLYPARDHVDVDNIDIIFTQDHLGINAGSFFIKRSWFAEFVLDMWGDKFLIESKFPREEQDAFIYLFTNHKTVFHHTGLVPQRMMNAYHGYYLHTANWQEGDLCIHFAGHNKGLGFEKNFAHYWGLRKRVPKEFQINVPEEEAKLKVIADKAQKEKEEQERQKKEKEEQEKKEKEEKEKQEKEEKEKNGKQ